MVTARTVMSQSSLLDSYSKTSDPLPPLCLSVLTARYQVSYPDWHPERQQVHVKTPTLVSTIKAHF